MTISVLYGRITEFYITHTSHKANGGKVCTDRTRPVRTHFPSICFVGGVGNVKFSYPAIQYTNGHQTKKVQTELTKQKEIPHCFDNKEQK